MTQYVDGIAEIPQSRCIVSDDYRTITIPAKERTLGCVGDDETRRVWWDVPLANNGISLRGFEVSIHYVNAAGHANRYDVATAYVVDNRVLFAWLVQRGAYEAAGLVNVSIKMRTLDGTTVDDEFNSAIAPFSVKDAQNFDEQPQPEQTDWVGAFIVQQEARIDAVIALADAAIDNATDATTAANTAAANANAAATTATTAAQSANQAATAANSAATEATAAATDATDAAERAEQAAEGVESAIDAAQAAATSANSAAATASMAAANADSKAALANTAASTANSAAQAAESATTAANTAAGQATTAAGNATTAAQSATTAAGNADAKAALADTAAANADTATANANTATANANTATTNATNAAQAANNAAEYAIDAADDMPRLTATASGTTAQTVNDAWPTTMESAVLYGKSVQNGTPTPDNPVEVQVVEPYNLIDMRTQYDSSYFTLDGDTLTNRQTDTRNAIEIYLQYFNGTTRVTSQFLHRITATGEVTVTFTPTQGIQYDTIHIIHNGAKSNLIFMKCPVVLDEGISYTLSMDVLSADVTTIGGLVVHGIQIERGTVAHPYTPYGCIGLQTGETVKPIDLQGHTLAGLPDGTRDELDIDAAGVKTIGQRVGVVDMGTLEWSTASNNRFKAVLQGAKTPASNAVKANAMCAKYSTQTANDTEGGVEGVALTVSGNVVIYDAAHVSSSVAAFKTAMSGVLLYYELATPATIELGTITPPDIAPGDTLAIYASLDPEWAITYTQDPNVVISTLTGSIAPIEGNTASTNYAVGAYLIHSNQLYRVTSAIATGEAITPGTNCIACTVMGEVIRLTA